MLWGPTQPPGQNTWLSTLTGPDLSTALAQLADGGYFSMMAQYHVEQVTIYGPPTLLNTPNWPPADLLGQFTTRFTMLDIVNVITTSFGHGVPSPDKFIDIPVYIVITPRGGLCTDYPNSTGAHETFPWGPANTNVIYAYVGAQSDLSGTIPVATHEIVEALGQNGGAPKELCDDCKTQFGEKVTGTDNLPVASYFDAILNQCVAPPVFHPCTGFTITSVASDMVLDVPELSKAPLTKIQQWNANAGVNQQWQLRRNTSNIQSGYLIFSVNSSLVLDVPNLSDAAGIIIQQYPENGGANQQWDLRADSPDGGFQIISLNSGLVLDVPHSSGAAGTLIQQWMPNGGDNQHWVFSGGGNVFAEAIKNQAGADINISGNGFAKNQQLTVVYMGIPRHLPKTTGGIAIVTNAAGKFAVTGEIFIVPNATHDDAFLTVIVGIEDDFGNLLAMTTISAAYWVA
jgi:hypothetical protein